MQLEERTALRRVAGLSTELEDVTEVEYRQLRLERVVLVGVWTSGTDGSVMVRRPRRAGVREGAPRHQHAGGPGTGGRPIHAAELLSTSSGISRSPALASR